MGRLSIIRHWHPLSLVLGAFLLLPLSEVFCAPIEGTYASLSMGTLVRASVWSESQEENNRLIDIVDAELKRLEALYTVHQASPLRRVNENAGNWVALECEAVDLIGRAKRIARASAGAFDPTIGPLVNAWKIGFGGEDVPSAKTLKEAKSRVDYRRIALDTTPGACRVKIAARQELDLGAIAKGAAGSRIIEKLREAGARSAMLDLGGNVALLGASARGTPWRIGIQRPGAQRGDLVAVLEVCDKSVITSGAYERNIKKGGKVYGHILSAKTGMPSRAEFSSVTLVDADGAKADGWCTAFYAMGRKATLSYLKKHPDLHAILIDSAGKNAWVSAALSGKVTWLDTAIRIHTIARR